MGHANDINNFRVLVRMVNRLTNLFLDLLNVENSGKMFQNFQMLFDYLFLSQFPKCLFVILLLFCNDGCTVHEVAALGTVRLNTVR